MHNEETNQNFEKIEIEKKIYSFDGMCYDSLEELNNNSNENSIPLDNAIVYELGYIRNLFGKDDVISIKYNDTRYFVSACDEDGYYNYKFDASKPYDWQYVFGSISEYYKQFRDRGIVFENDVYHKITKKYKRILEVAK